MLILCYPRCTTCQKAVKWLEEQGKNFTYRNIKDENPSLEELRQWHNISGLPYKALGLKDKLPTMSEEEQFALLASDGMLVKRPLLVGDDFVLVGFKEADWAERL